jgi:hypothetical protein
MNQDTQIGVVAWAFIFFVLLVLLLDGCAPASGYTIDQATRSPDSVTTITRTFSWNFDYVVRGIDCEARVVCYLYDEVGIACVPLNATALEDCE